jgi:hypothetical protein
MIKIINVKKDFFSENITPLKGYLSFLDTSNSNISLYFFNSGTFLKSDREFLDIFPKSDLFQKWEINLLRNLDDSFLGKSEERLLLKGKRGHYFEIKEKNNKRIPSFLRAFHKGVYYMDEKEFSLRDFSDFNAKKIREKIGRNYFSDGNRRGLRNFLYKNSKRNFLL